MIKPSNLTHNKVNKTEQTLWPVPFLLPERREMKGIEEELRAWMEQNGSSYVPMDQFETKQTDGLQEAVKEERVIVIPWHKKTYLTLPEIRVKEEFCAKEIVARSSVEKTVGMASLDVIAPLINKYEEENHMTFSDEQRQGIEMICNSHFCVLTGGPGTGKTSVLKCAAEVIKKTAGRRVTLNFTSPTGKAAKRITESSGYEASTLQSYTGGFGGAPIQLKAPDVMFVDESSMMDLDTLFVMLQCLYPCTKIVLIGDTEQLPSVGIGSVLRDLIDSDAVRFTQLIKTFRQDESSTLFENIQNVKMGGALPLKNGSDFNFIQEEEDAKIKECCIKAYLESVERFGISETAVLTPYRKKGTLCSDALNRELQALVNPNGKAFKAHVFRDDYSLDVTYRVGDPVIQLVNRKGLANGEVGTVIDINDGKIMVRFPDTLMSYWKKDLDALDLAYALSIHKSQGSEYKSVIMPLSKNHRNLSRNLIYTGLSRAKKYCTVIGSYEVIREACDKQADLERGTFLVEEIQNQLYQMALKMAVIKLHNWS